MVTWPDICPFRKEYSNYFMTPVVQTLDSTIHGINHYTADKYYQYAFWLDIDFIQWILLSTCRFYDINFYKSLPNGLELLQLSSSSWFLFQLGSWKAKINCVKPTLKKTTYGIASSDINLCHAVWPLQHYKCLTGFLVSEVRIFSKRQLKTCVFLSTSCVKVLLLCYNIYLPTLRASTWLQVLHFQPEKYC